MQPLAVEFENCREIDRDAPPFTVAVVRRE
jgi:hypothetical protein